MCTYEHNVGFIMAESTTITVRLKPQVKEQLARLSQRTNRTRSYLAAEAIEAYIARESEIIEGISRGLEDLQADRLVPHDEAMAELDASIEETSREGK
jgi:predicted transcriptional regulator